MRMNKLAPIHPVSGTNDQMQTIPLSASTLTILYLQNGGFRVRSRLSVPLLNSFSEGVNGPRREILKGYG